MYRIRYTTKEGGDWNHVSMDGYEEYDKAFKKMGKKQCHTKWGLYNDEIFQFESYDKVRRPFFNQLLLKILIGVEK